MKIGQLVMLIKTKETLPPLGATGVIHSECCMSTGTRVMFGHHKNPDTYSDGAFCVRKAWLVPIDDADGFIAKEDQMNLDFSDRVNRRIADLNRQLMEILEEGKH